MLVSVDQSDATAVDSVSFAVIAAIAEAEGVDPVEIEPPEYDALYDVVNPEALDSLFAQRPDGTARAGGRVEFPYCGYRVVVEADGDVEVYDTNNDR